MRARKIWSKPVLDAAMEFVVEKHGFGFFDGGCLIFAKAVRIVSSNASIVTLLREGEPDHYGILLPRSGWGDFDGFHATPQRWTDFFRGRELVAGPISHVDAFVPSSQIPYDRSTARAVARILAGKIP